jgi:hypothetical protein
MEVEIAALKRVSKFFHSEISSNFSDLFMEWGRAA